MTHKHTPEPWYSRGCHVMAILDGKEVQIARADLCKVGEDVQKANARRIVACVNACRGLSTDDLEQKGLVAAVGNQLLDLDRQRDELLAALEALLQDYKLLNKTQARCIDIFGNPVSAEGSGAERASAAIAKAKGGAAATKNTGETK